MKWRLLLPLLLSIGAVKFVESGWGAMGKERIASYQRALENVGHMFTKYAETHDGTYSDDKIDNDTIRLAFVAFIDPDYKVYGPRKLTRYPYRGHIGLTALGLLQKLSPTECQINYVRGLIAGKSDPTTPLLFVRAVTDDGEIRLISVNATGSSETYPTTNGTVLQEQNGQQVDIFSEAYLKEKYGIHPQDILKPEGPHRDITALAHQRKMEILRIQAAIILLIWLPFLIPHWIKHRRKPQPHPETPTPQA